MGFDGLRSIYRIYGIICLAYCILASSTRAMWIALLFGLWGPVELCLKSLGCKCCRDDHENSIQQRNADEEIMKNPVVLSESDLSRDASDDRTSGEETADSDPMIFCHSSVFVYC